MFNNSIDWDNVKENDYEILPEGGYRVLIEQVGKFVFAEGEKHDKTFSSDLETKDDFVEIKFLILDGDHIGRVHYEQLRLWSDNEISAKIGHIRFKQLCIAANKDPKSGKLKELENATVFITLKHQKKLKKDGTPYINVVKIEADKQGGTPQYPDQRNDDMLSDMANDDVPF